jgi:cytochrome c551/c552
MSSCFRLLPLGVGAFATLLACGAAAQMAGERFPGIGRVATPAEMKAWDIDVRPDFKGLPKGQGSVRQGEVLWEAQCASCHGSFGESSDIFTPLVGGTSAQDMKSGRVDSLLPGANQPQRTTLMKVATLSTLWDYIRRAMPWTAPKSLSADEVYAVTAYMLHLGDVVPAEFTLSDGNIREIQERLPNRKGMTSVHAMCPGGELGGKAKPDVQGSACMRDCKKDVAVKSFLPDYARNAHGQLAEQSRPLGPSRGADTSRPSAESAEQNRSFSLASQEQSAPEKTAKPLSVATPPTTVLQKNACLACHGMDSKGLGPSFREIASKYKDRADTVNYLSGKIKRGGQGVWGSMPMPAQTLSEAEAGQVARWLAKDFLAK